VHQGLAQRPYDGDGIHGRGDHEPNRHDISSDGLLHEEPLPGNEQPPKCREQERENDGPGERPQRDEAAQYTTQGLAHSGACAHGCRLHGTISLSFGLI
jgi:hypothetical protein